MLDEICKQSAYLRPCHTVVAEYMLVPSHSVLLLFPFVRENKAILHPKESSKFMFPFPTYRHGHLPRLSLPQQEDEVSPLLESSPLVFKPVILPDPANA